MEYLRARKTAYKSDPGVAGGSKALWDAIGLNSSLLGNETSFALDRFAAAGILQSDIPRAELFTVAGRGAGPQLDAARQLQGAAAVELTNLANFSVASFKENVEKGAEIQETDDKAKLAELLKAATPTQRSAPLPNVERKLKAVFRSATENLEGIAILTSLSGNNTVRGGFIGSFYKAATGAALPGDTVSGGSGTGSTPPPGQDRTGGGNAAMGMTRGPQGLLSAAVPYFEATSGLLTDDLELLDRINKSILYGRVSPLAGGQMVPWQTFRPELDSNEVIAIINDHGKGIAVVDNGMIQLMPATLVTLSEEPDDSSRDADHPLPAGATVAAPDAAPIAANQVFIIE
jgi:hypothetical protein